MSLLLSDPVCSIQSRAILWYATYRANMYKYLFKDPDCTKIAPSDLQLGRYTNKKVKIIGSCNLYIIHPDTRCIEEIPFFVASKEGSILTSCRTSLASGLIKPHEKLDHPPPEGNRNIIYSSADKIKNESWLKVYMLVQENKLKTSIEEISDVCSIQEQSSTSSNKGLFYDGCSKKEKSNNTTCTDNGDKNCQAEKCEVWPKKLQMDKWLKKSAMTSTNKKLIESAKKKNCQATICEHDDFKGQSSKCFDKEGQENINMWSVSNTDHMQLPKTAIRRLCSDKNYQSTRCYATGKWVQGGQWTGTVNLCNLNLKELYYHCQMWTAMKAIILMSVELIVNGLCTAWNTLEH